MNPSQPYEQTINDKLNSLPIPDMADAIWADIEAQLDMDLPGNDNPAPDNAPTGGGGWPIGIKLSGIVAGIAVAAYLLIQLNSSSKTVAPPPFAPTEKTMPITDTAQKKNTVTPLIAPESNNKPTTVNPTVSPQASSSNAAQLPSMIDSLQLSRINIPPTKTDTATIAPPALLPILLPKPGKKPRGTQGIQDSDYKFVRGKDST